MTKRAVLTAILGLFCVAPVFAQPQTQKTFLIDGFEGPITAGQTIDVSASSGSFVSVSADTQEKHGGAQSLKVDFDAPAGGTIRIARGYGLDVKGAAAWSSEPEKIAWTNYAAISFYLKGTGAGGQIAFDLKDAGGKSFRFMVKDDSRDWRLVVCPFDQFSSGDDGTLDFPIKSFQFEPIAVSHGTFYVDDVSLEPLN